MSTTEPPSASLPGEFALCLTHDVDRPYKTYQGLYHGLRRGSGYHLGTLRPGVNPYWQFETIVDIEAEFDVRSAFYFLDEPSLFAYRPRAWLRPANWVEHAGRYDVTAPAIREVVGDLDDGGWEVGLHASRLAASDPDRLAAEKERLEDVLGHRVRGCRHHHLRLDGDTWHHHRAAGFDYDASLGHADMAGFQHGHAPRRPFDDDFLVLPLTAMEVALPDPGENRRRARSEVDRLLRTAERHGAVMTALWHPRYFNEREFPGYRDLYRYLIRRALAAGAWVGPPRDLVDALTAGDGRTTGTRRGKPPDARA
jgi:hypothetical protein